MNISIVIPNYNGAGLFKKNLPKIFEELKNYEKGKTEVIVVDDGSLDDSIKVLNDFRNEYKNLKVFENEKNLGFSSTVNKGVSKTDSDIIILLNTDVYPQKGFLEPLFKNFEDEKVFAVGCLEKSIEGKDIVLRGRGLGKWEKGFLIHRRGEVDKKNTLWASGGSSAFRKSIWEKLGGLNELYNPLLGRYRLILQSFKIRIQSII